MEQYRSILEERNKAYHDEQRLFREKGHMARGAVTLTEQVDVVLSQFGTEDALRKRTPKILSFTDFSGNSPRVHLDLAGWPLNASFHTIAARSIPPGIPAKASVCVYLNIRDSNISDNSLESLKQMPALEYLNVSNCHSITDTGLYTIRRYLPQLKTLCISHCVHLTGTAISATWEGCPRLDTLQASHLPGLSDKALAVIANAKRKGELIKSLDVSFCRSITAAGILAIADSPYGALETFCFHSCSQIDSMAFFAFGGSTSLVNLRHLNVSKLRMEASGVSWLVEGGQALETLDLSDCRGIDDPCLEMLSRCPNLRQLNVSGCPALTNAGLRSLLLLGEEEEEKRFTKLYFKSCLHIGDEGLSCIGSTCPALSVLDLRGLPRVTDEGILHIAKGCCLSLKELRVSGCGSMSFYGQPDVSDKSLIVLGKLCRDLECLDAAGCVGISDAGVVKLAKCCPNLTSLNLSSTSIGDESVAAVAVHCTKLKNLNVSQNKTLSNAAVLAIALGLSDLKQLNLQYCINLDDTALRYLSQNYLHLERLVLNGNERITDDGLQTLCSGCLTLRDLSVKDCPVTTRTGLERAAMALRFGSVSADGKIESKPEYWNRFLEYLIVHYRSALTLQTRFRRWQKRAVTLSSLTRRRLRRENAAARTIQKCGRQYLQWLEHLKILSLGRNLHLVTLVQATYRGNQSRWKTRVLFFTKTRASRVIQRQYRSHLAFVCRTATTIQRVYRGYLGRLIYHELLHEKENEAANAIIIWYGKCMRRFRMAQRARHLIQCVRKLQAQARAFLATLRFRRAMRFYRQRIVLIQTRIRIVLAIQFVARKRASMHAAALDIQRVYHGHRARCYVERYRILAYQSATLIQAVFRSYSARRRFLTRRSRIVFVQRRIRFHWTRKRYRQLIKESYALRLFLAAQRIQKHWRGVLGRRKAVLFAKIRNAVYYEKGQDVMQFFIRKRLLKTGAAVILQRYVVRWRAKRVLRGMKRFRRFHAKGLIQRNVRGWYERVCVVRMRQQMEEAALDIERVYRGHVGRTIYNKAYRERLRQQSAILIQSFIRRFLAQCMYQYKRETYEWAAGMVQRVFRGMRGRCFFALKRAELKLKVKDEYMSSVKGLYESKRDGLKEKYELRRLDRHVQLLKELKEEWERRTSLLTDSVRPLKKRYKESWRKTNETISENLRSYRKLIGVTENVYVGKNEFKDETIRHAALTEELKTIQQGIMEFKYLLRTAISEKRVIEPQEFWQCAEKANVFSKIA